MAIEVKFDLKGIQPLIKSLQVMPAMARTLILHSAANKAGKTIANSIRKKVPYQAKQRKPALHYRDVVTNVVRDYPTTDSVVAVIGAESRTAPHAHLVEEGTGPRFTNHKTQYRRMAVRARTVIKKGRAVTVVEKERKSIGSFQKKNKRPVYYRGRMPAFHPVKLGLDAVRSQVVTQLENDIRAGITREFTEAKIARGM